MNHPMSSESRPTRRGSILKAVLWTGLFGLMALGFVGYLMPGVSLSWETLVSLCGF